MPDVFTKEKRSAVMARIRSKGNRDTELALIGLFRRHRISGWRRHQNIFGKPDFVFRRARLVVFVDGCFWHSCPRHATKPKNNELFWRKKLAGNRARDRVVNRTLRRSGWRVVRIWECDLAAAIRSTGDKQKPHKTLVSIQGLLQKRTKATKNIP